MTAPDAEVLGQYSFSTVITTSFPWRRKPSAYNGSKIPS